MFAARVRSALDRSARIGRKLLNQKLQEFDLALEQLPYDRVNSRSLEQRWAGHTWSGAGVDFRHAEQRRFLHEKVAPHAKVFETWPTAPVQSDPGTFYFYNTFFGPVDAEVYYAMVRAHRPQRLLEVGSGFSTRVARQALDDNGLGEMTCIDPFPRNDIGRYAHQHLAAVVQDIDVDRFAALRANDVLFIDSSHRLETGGDLPFLLLEALPRLASGVLVHFHDIFLPFEYPRRWVISEERRYNEQYAIGAMLAHSSRYRVEWATNYMLRTSGLELGEVIRSLAVRSPARLASLWVRVL
jgi:predicted O-methyltransferase YrrM